MEASDPSHSPNSRLTPFHPAPSSQAKFGTWSRGRSFSISIRPPFCRQSATFTSHMCPSSGKMQSCNNLKFLPSVSVIKVDRNLLLYEHARPSAPGRPTRQPTLLRQCSLTQRFPDASRMRDILSGRQLKLADWDRFAVPARVTK